MKHMSFNGRKTVIKIVSDYNKKHPNKKIPLISSHSGYSGFTKKKMAEHVKSPNNPEHDTNKEFGVSQSRRESFKELEMTMRYNSWSINLATEEVRDIVDSGGLIGLSFEQNILGVAFLGGKKGLQIKKLKTQREKQKGVRETYTMLIAGQLCKMAEAAGSGAFWKCISIGTDFDGLIDPVDGYSSALFYDLMRESLLEVLKEIDPVVRAQKYFMPQDDAGLEELVDDFCFNNAARFIQKHFDKRRMPTMQPFMDGNQT
jgi:hypothetical protein